jgi:amphi-Trp domain-containing protein
MAKVKFKKTETMSRAEAAARLSEVANALGSGSEFELERGGEKLKLDVPDEVTLELEVEVKDDETEIEVEVKWSSQRSSTASSSPGSVSRPVDWTSERTQS